MIRIGDGRRLVILWTLWTVVPILTVVYSFLIDVSIVLIIASCMSAVMMILGSVICRGHIFDVLMSDEELKGYDKTRLTSYVGLSFVTGAFILFFMTMTIALVYDDDTALAVSFLVLIVIVLIGSFYGTSKSKN